MRRFFRSAAFPILIVIVLAFFAQKLISGPGGEPTPNYTGFLAQVKNDSDSIESVTVDQKSSSVTVNEQDGKSYSTGYPNTGNGLPQLLHLLDKNHIQAEV